MASELQLKIRWGQPHTITSQNDNMTTGPEPTEVGAFKEAIGTPASREELTKHPFMHLTAVSCNLLKAGHKSMLQQEIY